MNNICIIEDHDRALKIWKDNKVKSVDLVHVDAHVDFDFYKILPVKYIVECSRSLKELKRNLENNIAFNHYRGRKNPGACVKRPNKLPFPVQVQAV